MKFCAPELKWARNDGRNGDLQDFAVFCVYSNTDYECNRRKMLEKIEVRKMSQLFMEFIRFENARKSQNQKDWAFL